MRLELRTAPHSRAPFEDLAAASNRTSRRAATMRPLDPNQTETVELHRADTDHRTSTTPDTDRSWRGLALRRVRGNELLWTRQCPAVGHFATLPSVSGTD